MDDHQEIYLRRDLKVAQTYSQSMEISNKSENLLFNAEFVTYFHSLRSIHINRSHIVHFL